MSSFTFTSRCLAAVALATAASCTNDYDRFVVGEGAGPPGQTNGNTTMGAGGATQGATTSQTSGPGGAGAGGAGVGGAGVGGAGVGGAGVGGAGVGGGIVSCAVQYGLASGYVPCPGQDCSFIANTSQTYSCNDICETFGGECVAMIDNSVGCGVDGPVACDNTSFNDAICQCSIGCGGGPPCVGQTCQGGVCQ